MSPEAPRQPGPQQSLTVHFDGACESGRGGGIATWAFTVQGGGLDHEDSGLAAEPGSAQSTNNVAEYTGAIRALEYLRDRGYHGPVRLVGDSELVIRQLKGEYRVRHPNLRPLNQHLVALISGFASVEPIWVRREENQRADELTKRAIYAASRGPSQPR